VEFYWNSTRSASRLQVREMDWMRIFACWWGARAISRMVADRQATWKVSREGRNV
jgi:hypothetical protein